MSNFKPGEFRITDQALKIWNLPKGAEILDIGCGQGEAVEYLEREYGYKASGIDLSREMIKDGLARNPELNIKYGDGEFLEDYTSFSFDGVMMECALSLISMPDEALHETYCVLKKGGKLFISDLYVKDPAPEFLEALQIEAERQKNIPHDERECGVECAEEHRNRAVNFRASGRFLMAPLIALLQETGYTEIAWEDCSMELNNYVAEVLMRDGTLERCFCKDGLDPDDKYKTGYFMLTAEKPL